MKTIDRGRLRDVLLGLTEGGKRTVTNAMLYQTLDRKDAGSQRLLLRQLQGLVRMGEIVRVGRGEMRYVPEAASARNGQLYSRIWRAVRAKKPGFSTRDLALVSGAALSHVRHYVHWLERAGYLRRNGRDGNTVLYAATKTARERLDTPYPPLSALDSYGAERNAACRLVRLLMERDPITARRRIAENCAIIMDRFGDGASPAAGERTGASPAGEDE
ncbi:MAG: hypothetical protein AB7D57_07320 [Desulfovibrionaceae bacterium]